MSDAVKKEIEGFLRGLLSQRLAQCTEKQRALFDTVYPGGVPDAKLEDAIDLCDRTIQKNMRESERSVARDKQGD